MKASQENERHEDWELKSSRRIRRIETFLCIIFIYLLLDKTWFIQYTSTLVKVSDVRKIKRNIFSLEHQVSISATEMIELKEKNIQIEKDLSQISEKQAEELIQIIPQPKLQMPSQWSHQVPITMSRDIQSIEKSNIAHDPDNTFLAIPVERKLQSTQASSKEQKICRKQPTLSPINEINGFVHDERVDRILKTILAISSQEELNRHDTPQYKATCYLLYDDERQIDAENKFLIQRYILSLFLFATQRNVQWFLPNNYCDHESFSCSEDGGVTKIHSCKYLIVVDFTFVWFFVFTCEIYQLTFS